MGYYYPCETYFQPCKTLRYLFEGNQRRPQPRQRRLN